MTISMKVQYSKPPSNLAKFNLKAALAAWADEVGPVVREALKDAAPVGVGAGAGRLRDSIRYERQAAVTGITLLFTANTPYAKYVIDGTAPHEIRPKAARMLHWTGDGGESHFGRVVHHPGTQPNNFAERAIKPLETAIRAQLVSIIQKTLGG